MRTKRIHAIEIRRFYQRIENAKRREARQAKPTLWGLCKRKLGLGR